MALRSSRRQSRDDEEDVMPSPRKNGLEIRCLKQSRGLRNWCQLVSGRVQLDTPELPDRDPKKIKTRGDPPAAFSLQVARIEQWPFHRAFLQSVKKSKNILMVSAQITFFHLPSSVFFGSTWQSKEVEVNLKSLHDFSGDTAFRACDIDLNEIVYWYTFVDDSRTAVVLELVASEYDMDEGVKVGSVGSGWTILNPSPFGHRGALGSDDPIELASLPIFTGSPRSLAMCGDIVSRPRDLIAAIQAGRLDGVEKCGDKACVKYRVAHFPTLLKARHLIAENELVGGSDLVPGLVKRRVGSKSERCPMLGSRIDESNIVFPASGVHVSRRRITQLEVSKCSVKIQDSDAFEDAMARHFDWSLKEDESKLSAYRRLSDISGRGAATASETQAAEKCQLSSPVTIEFQVMSRRLRFMCHNGRTFSSPGCLVPMDFKSHSSRDNEGNGTEVSELVPAKSSKTWKVGNLQYSPYAALVVFLEYVVRPDQSGMRLPGVQPSDKNEREEWINSHASQVTVVVGSAHYLPWDGKLFRLRSSFDPRVLLPVEGTPNKFELPLSMDSTTCNLSSQHPDRPLVWPPAESDNRFDAVRNHDKRRAFRYVKFSCDAFSVEYESKEATAKGKADNFNVTMNKTAVRDGTPEPSDEVEYDGEEKDGEESDSVESSEGSDSEDESVDRRRTRSPVKSPQKTRKPQDMTSLGATVMRDDRPESPKTPESLETADSDLWVKSGVVPRHRHRDLDSPESSPRERRNFGRATSSLLAQIVQAPLLGEEPPSRNVYFGDAATLLGPSQAPAFSSSGMNMGYDGSVHEMSRGSKARADMHLTALGGDAARFTSKQPNLWGAPNLSMEMADSNCLNAVFIRFLAIRATSATSPLPERLSFSFRFFDKPPRRTPAATVGEVAGSLNNSKPHPLICDGGAGASGLEERMIVDVSEVSISEAFDFFTYLATRKLQIDVWGGDSLILLGSVSVPLRPLLREQKNSVQVALEYDIMKYRDDDDCGLDVIGRLQLSLTNYGGKGVGGAAGSRGPVKVAPVHEPVGPFNWRFVSDQMVTTTGEGGNRPTHRKRARPLIDSGGGELKHAVDESISGKNGLAYSGSSSWSEGNTVSYEDLSSLAKRFRSSQMKGYVAYRGPLMQLLDAPSVISAENKLVVDLTSLEERGGRSLESIVQLLDRNNIGFISSDDLTIGLKSLCPSGFGRLRAREANMLTSRIERSTQQQIDGYPILNKGGVSCADLVSWVRTRQKGGKIETKIERLFRVFELKSGVSACDVLKGSLNSSEFIAAVRSMQQTIGLKKDPTSDPAFLTDALLKQFVEKQGGSINSTDYLTEMGLSVPVEKKHASKVALQELRSSINRIGEARLGSVFETWLNDSKEGTASTLVTIDEALSGLTKYGVVRRIQVAEARKAVCEIDGDEDGMISCSDLFRFSEWSWDNHVEQVMRSLLIGMEGVGEGLESLIGDKSEVLSRARFEQMVKDTEKLTFPRYLSDTEVNAFLVSIASNGESAIGGDVVRFAKKDSVGFGSVSLKRILLTVEASGTLSIHEIFQRMDKDGNGTLSHDELIEGLKTELLDAELSDEVEAAVRSLGEGKGLVLRDFMSLVGRPFSTYLEARLEAVIRKSNIDISTVFGALDKDGDGTVTVDELLAALLEINGFEDAKSEDVKELLSQFDSDGDGNVSLAEFCKVMGQHFKAADTEAMFVKLLGRAVKLGFSLRQCFDELDHSGDGEVDATELQAGLIALGGSIPMFKDIQPEDVDSLVKHISGGGNRVTRHDFLSWGKKHKLGDEEDLAAPQKRVESLHREDSVQDIVAVSKSVEEGKYADPGDAEETKSDHVNNSQEEKLDEDEFSASKDYVFSSDPFTASAERKLRRVAQSFQSRAERLGGWCDVEELFTRYDKANLGCIMKAEFVNVLMQLGLSLVDIPGGESNLGKSNDERSRRLAQLSRAKGGVVDKSSRLRIRDAELSRVGKEGGDEELALIKWYREGQKKSLVKNMVESGVKSEYHLFPRFGTSVFFEHPLVNPFNGEERLMVEIEGSSGLRLLTDFEEWVHFRRKVKPPPGFPQIAASIEPDMFAVDRGGAQLLVGAHETVPLPLCFLSLSESHMAEEHTCLVKLISAKHGVVVALIEIHIHPRAPIVHRSLRFNQGEGSIVKRHVRLPPEDSGKFISPVEFGEEKRVVVESRVSGDGCQEIGIKYSKLSGFPSSGDFYLLIFDDEYRSSLYQLWHVVVSSRLRKDVHGAVGVASSLELVVRGERHQRLVRAFSSNESDISFHPSGPFILHPGVYNQVNLSWLPKEAGSGTEHVHLVDMETNQLVVAWLVSTVATPPHVSKEFDVDVVVGEAAHKRVSYNNPWSRAQSYTLRSSDPNRMRPKTNRLHIDAHGQAYIRLFIAPVQVAGVSEVFLLVNDEQDQNDECFRILIRADA